MGNVDQNTSSSELLSQQSFGVFTREVAVSLVDQIVSLNVLNLVLEPAFSFKGCVGLPLGMVFRMAHHVERMPPLDQVKLLMGKLNLFTFAQHRS